MANTVKKKYNKPYGISETDLVATKLGWCYKPNHNEVLVAVGYLNDKLAAQEVEEEEVEEEEVEEEEEEEHSNV